MPSPLHDYTTLDNDIIYCQRHRVLTQPKNREGFPYINTYGGDPVVVGNFIFDCQSHDTGNAVQIHVTNGEKSRHIVNTVYWFSSRYTFNESKWESGPWDKALNEAIKTMKAAVAEHKLQAEAEAAKHLEEKKAKEQAEIDSWAKVFS